MKKTEEEDLVIWDLVHNWCEGLQVEIPDMARRYLMDQIEQYTQQVSKEKAVEFTSYYLQSKRMLIEKELIELEFKKWIKIFHEH